MNIAVMTDSKEVKLILTRMSDLILNGLYPIKDKLNDFSLDEDSIVSLLADMLCEYASYASSGVNMQNLALDYYFQNYFGETIYNELQKDSEVRSYLEANFLNAYSILSSQLVTAFDKIVDSGGVVEEIIRFQVNSKNDMYAVSSINPDEFPTSSSVKELYEQG